MSRTIAVVRVAVDTESERNDAGGTPYERKTCACEHGRHDENMRSASVRVADKTAIVASILVGVGPEFLLKSQ